jgi:DNA (cytosine-5)-methyltransferase 1
MQKKHTFIDVFSGCGGLSFGLESAGWSCLAAIDHNEQAIATLNKNHLQPIGTVQDLRSYYPSDLAKRIGTDRVTMVVGGPPCQGFSTARQAGGANSGQRIVLDSRRDLYQRFLAYVKFFSPDVFVIENVLGIKTAASGAYFTKIQNESRSIGYSVVPIELKCWEFGVPQQRVRQLFIGTKIGLPLFVPDLFLKKTHTANEKDAAKEGLQKLVLLGEAIGDLPTLTAGTGHQVSDYDQDKRLIHLNNYGGRYIVDEMKVDQASRLTWHIARPHSERDLRDFARLLEGETSRQALARGVEMEFPYSRETFKDRYTRQSRYELSSTIVAHLKADGLMFIHPTEPRSFTPREAARVQSFPDTFDFCGLRSHVYQQVGNAVPPIAARALGYALNNYLSENRANLRARESFANEKLKTDLVHKIEKASSLRETALLQISKAEFLDIWYSIHKLHPALHPENSLDETGEIKMTGDKATQVSLVIAPYYKRSGWPLDLICIAKEARRRFDLGELDASEYYFRTIYDTELI